jgi:YesN/AraC family two-component response regulator
MQISPVKYINSLRIEKAKAMLKNSNFSVEEIAYCVGINDRFYFSRIFKKELGISPTEYRKRDL